MVVRKIRQFIKDNRGQAMVAALVCLALGGLIIAPVASFAGTSLHSVSLRKSDLQGLYAADAGIEDVVWSIQHGTQPQTSLAQNLNGMQVTMATVDKGNYTMIAGDWLAFSPSGHFANLHIVSNITWDAEHGAHKYTITITWDGPGNCWLISVGARLPLGYDYQPESVHLFAENMCTDEPSDQLDAEGAHMREWIFPTKIKFDPSETRYQKFLLDGSGDPEDRYSWAVAERTDVGEVGELSGAFYVITATATNPQSGQVTGKVVADVMVNEGGIYIVSWKIVN